MRRTAATLAVALLLAACDQYGRPLEHPGLDRLKPGVSTELDVRGVFGVPDLVVEERDGNRVFHYPQGPEGPRTFFAVLGADGRLVRVWNVLVPETFAQVRPGMTRDDVRLLLGRHGQEKAYNLKRQTAWEWKFVDGNSTKLFYVMFDAAGRVVESGIEDPSLSSGR
jgi:outer membrane protein assembly factor BamE (lipoprotein component of BamABCDE complex)